jgi:uncharacterized protein YndB with AHSA1/START domain
MNTALSTLCVTRRFDADAGRVFDAWLDPATAGRWLFSADGGEMVKVAIDARAGGHFLFIDRRDGEDVEHVGEYLEIDRPHVLAFTFAVPKYSSLSTQVRIELEQDAGACMLTLTHAGVLPEWSDRTREGWAMILDHLADTL